MPRSSPILRVAVPCPIRRVFDYLPAAMSIPAAPGMRVRVPFGRRDAIGVVMEIADTTLLPRGKLKPVKAVLDEEPVISGTLLTLLNWAAEYYHHPLGEVVHGALPVLLRQGRDLDVGGITVWRLTPEGAALAPASFSRAPLKRKIFDALAEFSAGLDAARLMEISPGWRTALRPMIARGWVSASSRDCLDAPDSERDIPPALGSEQVYAAGTIANGLGGFHCYLLHGVTGSGKTEVYLQVVKQVLDQGRQVLVLAPEIGLTPQLVERFRQRFRAPVAVLHSGLNDRERLCSWTMARSGRASIILGTRSAVFTPMKHPGLIVVDEEHDPSYKQQDGFRYHARNIAIMRASRENIPIVLGSATPSLESLRNALQGNYRLLELPTRSGVAEMPTVNVLDMRRLAVRDGLSHPLREQLRIRLDRGEQSLLFLNRRGFAPVWMCNDCGWVAPCLRCDARMTLHRKKGLLRCHHCGAERTIPADCPECGGANLHPLGAGTERVEEALGKIFPNARIMRIDRDSTRRKGVLESTLRRIHAGDTDILVGTQMLSKGHDFPNVTLVGVLNADQGLYSADFRAGEQLVQQIMQVSGRAGRASIRGAVVIQTYHPDNTLFEALRRHDYRGFADYALAERRQTGYPPYAFLALLRAESPKPAAALRFMREARDLGEACLRSRPVQIMEPGPSPMERRAGRYRAQLLVQSEKRAPLHAFLRDWLPGLEQSSLGKRVRWSLDVDPLDMH